MNTPAYKFSLALKLTAMFVLLSSCTYNFGEPKIPAPRTIPNIEKPKPDPMNGTMKVEYATIREHALNSCKACHSGIQEPLLNSIDTLKANSEKLLNAIEGLNGVKFMPPKEDGYDPLTTCQVDLVKSWITQGAPETSEVLVSSIESCDKDLNGGPKNILEMPVNYQTLNKMILQPKCISCHNEKSSSDAAFSPLYPYQELAGRRNLIGRNSATSKFVRILASNTESRMPPFADDNGNPLDAITADELEFVKRLVDAGFPEN